MSSHHNESLSLDWLMPLFEEQLMELDAKWRTSLEGNFSVVFADMAQDYHQLRGAMVMANLRLFSELSMALSALSLHISEYHANHKSNKDIDSNNHDIEFLVSVGENANTLLLEELKNHANTGSYRHHLVSSSTDDIATLIPESRLVFEQVRDLVQSNIKSQQLSHLITLPEEITDTLVLTEEQQNKLKAAWSYHHNHLLKDDTNESKSISQMHKMSQFIWRSSQNDLLQRLWYLTCLWLSCLSDNKIPKPHQYGRITSQLRNVIDTTFKCNSSNQELAVDENLQYEALIADLYIQINLLNHINDSTKKVIKDLQVNNSGQEGFFAQVLSKLETIIFQLNEPKKIVAPLQEIKQQLDRRGWGIYVIYLEQILSELEYSVDSDEIYAQIQWQIERQLQELYGVILATQQTIDDKIGHGNEVYEPSENDSNSNDRQSKTLRQVRIDVETLKTEFNSYITSHEVADIPQQSIFDSIDSSLSEMQMEQATVVVTNMSKLFDQIRENQKKRIGWKVIDAIADSIAEFELFLDYLAQQVLQLDLLTKASEHLAKAQEELNSNTEVDDSSHANMKPVDDDVIRYDDTGEVISSSESIEPVNTEPHIEDNKQNNKEDNKEDNKESPELTNARSNLKEDDFELADEEIKEIFIEEAEEVLESLDEYLPIWQQDTQDISALKEIRRGFHTLKGSGRMVGANNVGEMSWAVENMLNRVLDNTLEPDNDVVTLIADTKDQIPTLVEDFAQNRSPSIDPAITVLKAINVQNGEDIHKGLTEAILTQEKVKLADSESKQVESIVDETIVEESIVEENIADEIDDSMDINSVQNPVVDELNTSDDISDDVSDDVNDNELISDGLISDDSGNDDLEADSLYMEDADVNLNHSDDGVEASSAFVLPSVIEPFWQDSQALPADADDIDDDFKEIFIEEAEEVLEEITPQFQSWSHNREDISTLKDVRRGFHTLKGSGRMVGANHTGELAWSVENMLNRMLDNTIEADDGIVTLISDILHSYPQMVEVFEKGTNDYPDALPLWIAVAQAYSKGNGSDIEYDHMMAEFRQSHSDTSLPSIDSDPSINQDHSNNKDNAKNQSSSHQAKSHKDKLQADANASMLASLDKGEQQMADSPTIEDSLDEDEREFVSIFIEEAKERLDVIDNFVQDNKMADEAEVSDELVRAFHTLRGASGVDSLQAISEISGKMENNLTHLQQSEALMNAQHIDAVAQSSTLIANYLNAYESQDNVVTETASHVKVIETLLNEGSEQYQGTDIEELNIATLMDAHIDDLLDAEFALEDELSKADEAEMSNYTNKLAQQANTLLSHTTQSSAFQSLLRPMQQAYEYLASNPNLAHNEDTQLTLIEGHEQLTGLFDSLAGSMSLQIDSEIIHSLQALSDGKSDDISDKMLDTSENLIDQQAELPIEESQPTVEEPEPVVVIDVEYEDVETDPELLEIFLEESNEIEEEINRSFSNWRKNPNDLEALKELQRHLHTIKGAARMSGISSIGDLTHEMETVYEKFVNQEMHPSDAWLHVMQGAQDTLSMQVQYANEQKTQSFFATDTVEQLKAFMKLDELPSDASVTLPVLNTTIVKDTFYVQEAAHVESSEEEDEIARNYHKMVEDSWRGERPDSDILVIYLEEADELIESSVKNLQEFKSNTGSIAVLQALQRELHTIKGGARMVSANGIADLSHEMETVYEELGSRRLPATRMVLNLLTESHDWLANSIYLLKNKINPPTPESLIKALKDFHKNPDSLKEVPRTSLQSYVDAIAEYESYNIMEKGIHDISEMPPMVGNFGEFEEVNDISNEMIRVSSGLMEQMINLSGESAINRARIDMGISSLTNSIEEMGTTVQRLSDQLRRMDIELETQVMAQITDEKLLEDEGFDPLEMDQYSSLNQLSKSLSESASDLVDIKSTLLEKTRDSENLLLQLSRTQTELQDGLMRSRMVPFSRLTPRLQRIVRQTANEVNKQVELKLINADDEIDRTILEHITSPLEHMLRNAVDHGIELVDDREQMGKDKVGAINLSLSRDGSELVIRLSDDGNGIDVEAVRNKAIKQGLIDPNDTSLTNTDVMQYIFNAGLSTTNKVTQISGRGVGMDVVQSEVRQLGGTVSVESLKGKGSTFTMRVPLTVAMSDALVVRAADRHYAIPIVQIERVEQVNPEALFSYYQSDNRTFGISGVDYRLRYLNEILTGSTLNDLISAEQTVPVIIIKNQAGQNLALQVDEIVGSRIELVVKPLSKQLSYLPGISAATIMGNGSVMLILDLMALIRNAPMRKITTVIPETMLDNRKKVLVIDDSVTVRKVTSRFLEREGFDVHVAKDGVDALEILQEFTPDLMLLDIEMPRMDGFEVATQVRHNTRLKDTPIIMITSRTGDKHRERAMEIGVNDYLGKPFQENILIERIGSLLNMDLANNNND